MILYKKEVSSAYNFEVYTIVEKLSLIKIRIIIGQRNDPCGTPDCSSVVWDDLPFKTIRCCLFVYLNHFNNLNAITPIAMLLSLNNSHECQTLSKTF